MFSCDWADRSPSRWQPLQVREKALRGTISNRLDKTTEKDPAKLNAKVESPTCKPSITVPCPPTKTRWSSSFHESALKVLSGVEQPSACNLEAFAQTYRDAVRSYIDTEGFTEIARRYATNIANARFFVAEQSRGRKHRGARSARRR
ncbi:type I-F CRISPR-associated protein Cas7f/Csy3 [Rhodopirellula europaea]|uniref:type I-F CRISPR-associated protein Cas7f/Csy3 n=1 Tax=Rhodopirellula europaea TaxID=1263866 RepID=UPI003D29CBF0